MSPAEQGPNFCRSFLLQTFWPDEPPVSRALQNIRPKELKFNPHFYLYGAPAIYAMGAAIKLGQLSGFYPNPGNITPFLKNPDYSGRLWAAPRILFALSLSLAILVLYFSVQILFGEWWGVFAAFILAASPVTAMETHILKPYLISMLCTASMFYFLIRGKHRWAALLAGINAAFLITSSIFAVVIGAAALYNNGGKRAWKNVFICAVVYLIGFLGTNPLWIFSPQETISGLLSVGPPAGGIKINILSPLAWIKVWVTELPTQAGIYLAVPTAAGALAYAFKQERVVAYCLLTLLLITPMLVSLRLVHYVVPSMPAVIILAIYGLRWLWRLSPVISAAAMGVGSIFMILHMTFYQLILLNVVTVQEQASQWLNSNLPTGTTIATSHLLTPAYMYPPFRMAGHKFMVKSENTYDWLAKLNRDRPRFYISISDEEITQRPDFLKLYKKEVSFETRTSLDKLYVNELIWKKLTWPIKIYLLKV